MNQEVLLSEKEDSRILIFNKYVDWSILNEGVSIPVRHHQALTAAIGKGLKRGEKQVVKVRVNGVNYDALLTNIDFDQAKYPDHSDIIQFRWSKSGALAKELRKIFRTSYNDIEYYRANKNRVGKPELGESIAFLFNPQDQIIDLEYVSMSDFNEAKACISPIPEDVFEYQQNYYRSDERATIEIKDSTVKVRRMDRTVLRDLKKLYDDHCQICGTCFETYDIRFSEAHHIDHFVKSLNNDSDNILILCPNHHRVIHSAKPEFFYNGEYFLYPNGLKESLTNNRHIGKAGQGDNNG